MRLLARSGIGPHSTVVFHGYAPALGFWLMKLYGSAATASGSTTARGPNGAGCPKLR
jgi:hypothetical protein